MPVSATEKITVSPGPGAAETRTSPCSVNLSALEMKLRRICDSFDSSVSSGFISGGASKISGTDASCARGRKIPRRALNSCATWNGSLRTGILPACALARSSRSSMNCARSRAVLRMMRTCLSCSSVSSPSRRWSRNCEIDRIEWIGVRISCPMSARMRDLRSAARRWYSARSSSSAYSDITPRLVSSSSPRSARSISSRCASSRVRCSTSAWGSLDR